MLTISFILFAIFITLILTPGIYSSWEFAAVLTILISLLPLILFTEVYINFLKTVLFDMQVIRLTNFTIVLFFDSVIIAYAFNAWIRMFFIAVFIGMIAWKLDIFTSLSLPQSIVSIIPTGA